MEEFSDFIQYLVSYFDIGQNSRHHPFGDIIFLVTYTTILVLLQKSFKVFYQIKKNSVLSTGEKKKMLNFHVRRIIIYVIFLVLLSMKLMSLAPVRFLD